MRAYSTTIKLSDPTTISNLPDSQTAAKPRSEETIVHQTRSADRRLATAVKREPDGACFEVDAAVVGPGVEVGFDASAGFGAGDGVDVDSGVVAPSLCYRLSAPRLSSYYWPLSLSPVRGRQPLRPHCTKTAPVEWSGRRTKVERPADQ